MLGRLFKKKVYQHKVVYTYLSGTSKTKYKGEDDEQARKVFNEGKTLATIFFVNWYRDGELYKHE